MGRAAAAAGSEDHRRLDGDRGPARWQGPERARREGTKRHRRVIFYRLEINWVPWDPSPNPSHRAQPPCAQPSSSFRSSSSRPPRGRRRPCRPPKSSRPRGSNSSAIHSRREPRGPRSWAKVRASLTGSRIATAQAVWSGTTRGRTSSWSNRAARRCSPGGVQVGATESSPGEWRGGTVRGADARDAARGRHRDHPRGHPTSDDSRLERSPWLLMWVAAELLEHSGRDIGAFRPRHPALQLRAAVRKFGHIEAWVASPKVDSN